jgi:Aspartyl protease
MDLGASASEARWIVAVVVVAGAAALRPPAAPTVDLAPGDGSVVVNLEPYVGRLVTVSATLQGEKMTLLLDTGGGETMITPRAAARIGCTPGGRSISFRMTGERVALSHCDTSVLEIGGHELARAAIAVWDVAAVLPKEFPPLDGVLALDTLAGQPFTLELGARRLTLESARSLERRIATMTPVRARTATGLAGEELTVLVRGSVDRPGWFLFDSGNLDLTYVAPHMLRREVAVPSRLESVALSVDGLPTREVAVGVRAIIYDGVLAEDFLRQWIWTFRLASGELWAAQARSGPAPGRG